MAKSSKTLHDAFLDELRDLYNAEKQITKALPKMAKAAHAAPLANAFQSHLKETEGQIKRLEQVFESLGEPVKSKTCEGIAGILEEGKDIISEHFDEAAMDAALIAAAQRAEHYEIGAYGTCVAWARLLGHDEVVSLLEQTLDEEKAADQKLTALAEGEINEAAAAQPEEGEDEERGHRTPARRQSSVKTKGRSRAADRRR